VIKRILVKSDLLFWHVRLTTCIKCDDPHCNISGVKAAMGTSYSVPVWLRPGVLCGPWCSKVIRAAIRITCDKFVGGFNIRMLPVSHYRVVWCAVWCEGQYVCVVNVTWKWQNWPPNSYWLFLWRHLHASIILWEVSSRMASWLTSTVIGIQSPVLWSYPCNQTKGWRFNVATNNMHGVVSYFSAKCVLLIFSHLEHLHVNVMCNDF